MTLEELIRRYRLAAQDKAVPYFVADEEVTDLLNDAQEEAAIRGRLIHEHSNVDVCVIPVTAGVVDYPLHESVYELTACRFAGVDDHKVCSLKLVSTGWLDDNVYDWRTREDNPAYIVQTDTGIRIAPVPKDGGSIEIECYRVPIEPMIEPDDEPELHKIHHVHLIQWVLHKVFSIPDTEFFDQERASRAESEFTGYFGIRPDSDLRRITREDVPHHNKAFWP